MIYAKQKFTMQITFRFYSLSFVSEMHSLMTFAFCQKWVMSHIFNDIKRWKAILFSAVYLKFINLLKLWTKLDKFCGKYLPVFSAYIFSKASLEDWILCMDLKDSFKFWCASSEPLPNILYLSDLCISLNQPFIKSYFTM